jgi:lactate permease
MFTQILNPPGNLPLTGLVALLPVILLLVLLVVFRISAWLATLIGSLATFVLAAVVWHMPIEQARAPIFMARRTASGRWTG